jgi:hypothetical protein
MSRVGREIGFVNQRLFLGGKAMTRYPEYTTTVVGSYSIPRWYEALEKQVEGGALTKADMADAQYRATQAAILDQESAGIDIITSQGADLSNFKHDVYHVQLSESAYFFGSQ